MQKYIDMYGIKKIFVISTGDMIEQVYMRNTQEHNCEFLQSMQIHKATKLIYRLLVALAEECNVVYGGIAGNHDRMSGDKRKVLKVIMPMCLLLNRLKIWLKLVVQLEFLY